MLDRRRFLVGAASTGVLACTRPLIKTRQPALTHAVQSGDVQVGRALVWARCDEPARMLVEWDTTDRFGNPRRLTGPVVTPDTGLAATVALDGLPAAQTIHCRVRFEREAARGASDWAAARFVTPGSAAFRFAWTGDTCGQGFGRNPDWGGLKGYQAIAEAQPAFFLHSGDLIYADNPILAEQKLADGRIWKNITNERVARVAETLDDFRARFAYNLEDDHVRALAQSVPILAQWDDHETHNNWWPGQQLDDDRYKLERDATKLSAFARRAMLEWNPTPPGKVYRVVHYGPLLDVIVLDCRSYRTPNDANRSDTGTMLGAEQVAWFIEAAAASKARWKVIACDQPLGLVIGDGPNDSRNEGFANGDGPPLGRERDIAHVLAAMKQRDVRNVVWLTADVHYAAAHHYDPARANGAAFDPFWEFVAGPIHAGTFGPNALDPTFGPQLDWQWVPPEGQGNLAPWDGMQTFGTVEITAARMTVRIHDVTGAEKHRVDIGAT